MKEVGPQAPLRIRLGFLISWCFSHFVSFAGAFIHFGVGYFLFFLYFLLNCGCCLDFFVVGHRSWCLDLSFCHIVVVSDKAYFLSCLRVWVELIFSFGGIFHMMVSQGVL